MKKYILKIKKYIIAEILLDMLCTIFAAYIPVLQKEMFDSLGGGKLSQIPVIIVLFVVL